MKDKVKVVPSAWLEREGRRLDCGPYLSGAMHARMLMERLSHSELSRLTHGNDGGIFNGPQFARRYVYDSEHGVPFLSSSSMVFGYRVICQ